MKYLAANIALFVSTSAFLGATASASSCPTNIGEYGYKDGRGGSFGETMMALKAGRPQCVCKLNKQWVKEYYYSNNYKVGFDEWLRECGK